MADQHPYGHDFNDTRPGDQGSQQNLLHAIRGGVMGGNEYRVQNMPRVSVYCAAGQVIVTGTAVVVNWDTREYDTDGMWNSADPSKFTARTPGLYLVTTTHTWAAAVAGYRQIQIPKNGGGTYSYGNTVYYDRDGVTSNMTISVQIPLNAGDYIQTFAIQATGGNLTFRAAGLNHENIFQACMISTL